jgi:hypothetical protein
MRRGVGPLTTLVTIAAALASAGGAQGAVVTETFDSYADGTTIDDQVAGVRITGTGRVYTPPAGRTQSSPRALRNPLSCPDTTCANGAYRLVMEFTRPVREVSLRTGDVLVGCFEFDCPRARLAGYRSDGTLAIASPSKPIPTGTFEQPGGFGGRITEPFTITTESHVITRAVLYVGKDDVHGEYFGSPRTAQIDNLVFDQLAPEDPPPPDPPPPPAAPTVEITDPPSGATFPTADVRLSGRWSAAAGLTAFCFSVDRETSPPSPCDLAPFVRDDGTFESLSVAGLHEGANRVSAWVTDGRGRSVQHTITINVAPRGLDLAGERLELVQAVQRYGLPFPVEPFEHGALRGFTGDYDDIEPDSSLLVPATRLVSGKRTLVRFFASAPGSGPVRNVRAVLHGWSVSGTGARTELPGSPIMPLFSPAQVERTLDLPAQRVRNDAAFGFELPTSWTGVTGNLILAGEVNPVLPGVTSECAACRDNNVFALKNVNFQTTRTVSVSPVNLYFRDAEGDLIQAPSFTAPFEGTRRMLPAALNVRPAAGAIDVSDIVSGGEDQVERMRDRLISWSEDRRIPSGKIMGLIDSGHGGLAGGRHGVTGSLRLQLDFVAHEFFHTLGYPHSGRSPTCYSREGDKGDSWPPDDRGVIRGMWVERLYDAPTRRNLFTPFGTPGAGFPMPASAPAEWIDFESYCSAEPTTWIDPRNWERGVTGLARRGPINISSVRPSVPSASAAQSRSLLRVTGALDGSSATIMRVEPAPGPATKADPASDLHVVVRNAGGGVVSDTAVPVSNLHVRPGPGEPPRPSTYVNAVVRARGAARVELVRGGAVLASRARSRSAPKVAVLAPARGARIGGARGSFVVRWRARDADGDALQARVDYSANNGRSWAPLGVALRGGSARLSKQFISRSKRARVRVIVNDGFRSATDVSKAFRVDGRPPVARILAPESRLRLNADAPLNLSGRGFDDAGAALRGKRLTWRSGGAVLGRGEELTVQAGEVQGGRVTLEVRDRHGRVARDRARVDVNQVKPYFVSATVARPGRRATSVVVRVASTSPATLTVTGKGVSRTTARVGQDVERVRVPIRRGQRSFTLALKLTAGSFVTEVPLAVARR